MVMLDKEHSNTVLICQTPSNHSVVPNLGVTSMSNPDNEVVVTDIKMPFRSMVVFMVKLAIATIPAIIILTAVGTLTFALISFFLGGTTHFRMYRF